MVPLLILGLLVPLSALLPHPLGRLAGFPGCEPEVSGAAASSCAQAFLWLSACAAHVSGKHMARKKPEHHRHSPSSTSFVSTVTG